MKILLVIVFINMLFCKTNTTIKSKIDTIGIDVENVEVSYFERDTWLISLNIKNNTYDTLYVKKIEKLNGDIVSEGEFFRLINLNFVNVSLSKIKTQRVEILSSMPPDILYTDSADNLDKYDRNILSSNYLMTKHIGDFDYWVISPNSKINVKIAIEFLLQDLSEIDINKLRSFKNVTCRLDVKLQYFKNNFDTQIDEIVKSSESYK
jgi:hypothetical protein